MVPTLTPSLVAMDMLCCMGLGFFVAALRVFIPVQGATLRFAADFCAVFFAVILAQSYAAQSSNAGILRFYMLVALALGAFVLVKVLSPYYLFFIGVAQCIFSFPFRIIFHKLVRPAFFGIKNWIIVQKEKIKGTRAQKTAEKQLQNQGVLLYNSNVDLYTFAE